MAGRLLTRWKDRRKVALAPQFPPGALEAPSPPSFVAPLPDERPTRRTAYRLAPELELPQLPAPYAGDVALAAPDFETAVVAGPRRVDAPAAPVFPQAAAAPLALGLEETPRRRPTRYRALEAPPAVPPPPAAVEPQSPAAWWARDVLTWAFRVRLLGAPVVPLFPAPSTGPPAPFLEAPATNRWRFRTRLDEAPPAPVFPAPAAGASTYPAADDFDVAVVAGPRILPELAFPHAPQAAAPQFPFPSWGGERTYSWSFRVRLDEPLPAPVWPQPAAPSPVTLAELLETARTRSSFPALFLSDDWLAEVVPPALALPPPPTYRWTFRVRLDEPPIAPAFPAAPAPVYPFPSWAGEATNRWRFRTRLDEAPPAPAFPQAAAPAFPFPSWAGESTYRWSFAASIDEPPPAPVFPAPAAPQFPFPSWAGERTYSWSFRVRLAQAPPAPVWPQPPPPPSPAASSLEPTARTRRTRRRLVEAPPALRVVAPPGSLVPEAPETLCWSFRVRLDLPPVAPVFPATPPPFTDYPTWAGTETFRWSFRVELLEAEVAPVFPQFVGVDYVLQVAREPATFHVEREPATLRPRRPRS